MDTFPPPPPAEPRPRASAPVTALFVLAVLYTLHFASELILPVLIALLMAMVLAPLVGWLGHRGLPRALAAGLVTVMLMGAVGIGIEILATPAADWLERAPQSFRELEHKLRPMKKPVEQVKQATEQVERLAGGAESKAVTVKSFDLGSVFVVSVTQLAAQTVVMVFLLYFLLASGDRLMRRFVRAPGDRQHRHRLLAVARRVKRDVGAYLGMITLINMVLGLAVGLAMWALNMPNPALWGVMTAFLNYIPYAGALLTMAVVAMVGLLTFDDLWRGLLPAGAVVVLHILESDLITPTLVGRRLTLPPMVVFLSLTVWSWLWGIAGALLAVPILVIVKVLADHVTVLRPLAPFLGGPCVLAGDLKRSRPRGQGRG